MSQKNFLVPALLSVSSVLGVVACGPTTPSAVQSVPASPAPFKLRCSSPTAGVFLLDAPAAPSAPVSNECVKTDITRLTADGKVLTNQKTGTWSDDEGVCMQRTSPTTFELTVRSVGRVDWTKHPKDCFVLPPVEGFTATLSSDGLGGQLSVGDLGETNPAAVRKNAWIIGWDYYLDGRKCRQQRFVQKTRNELLSCDRVP